jgi:hypothetical protein
MLKKILIDQIIKYVLDHREELIAQGKKLFLDYLGKIDADNNGKPDANETAEDIKIAFARLERCLYRTQLLAQKYGFKKQEEKKP